MKNYKIKVLKDTPFHKKDIELTSKGKTKAIKSIKMVNVNCNKSW